MFQLYVIWQYKYNGPREGRGSAHTPLNRNPSLPDEYLALPLCYTPPGLLKTSGGVGSQFPGKLQEVDWKKTIVMLRGSHEASHGSQAYCKLCRITGPANWRVFGFWAWLTNAMRCLTALLTRLSHHAKSKGNPNPNYYSASSIGRSLRSLLCPK